MAASKHLTPAEKAMRSRMASHVSWQNTADPSARTKPARDKFLQRFLDEVDLDRKLPEAERIRRAEHARKAYMTRLAFESAKARRRGVA